MTAIYALTLALLATTQLECERIELEHPYASASFLRAPPHEAPRLIVVDGLQLRVFRFDETTMERMITLPEQAHAVDVADLDRDGTLDVVALLPDRVLTTALNPGDPEWRTLFDAAPDLGPKSAQLQRLPIVHELAGQSILALPEKTGITLRNPDGTPIESESRETERSFTRRLIAPPQAAPPGGIEYVISAREALTPALDSASDLAQDGRVGTPQQLRDSASLPPAAWPWFPLTRDAANPQRVLYALDPPAFRDTLIRIWDRGERPEPGPQRRYPGLIIPPADGRFDANGDGYGDVVLWKSPTPAPTVSSIHRAIREKVWRVHITVHLFDPESALYAPRPAGQITAALPVTWFLQPYGNHPLRNLILTDLDGDQRDDIAFSQKEHEIEIFRYERAFSRRPDYVLPYPTPNAILQALARPSQNTGAILLFRSPTTLNIARIPQHTPD